MEQERPLDRRNRRWGSLENATTLHVWLSQRTKDILSALRNRDGDKISYGEVIERLAEQHANVLGQDRSQAVEKDQISQKNNS